MVYGAAASKTGGGYNRGRHLVPPPPLPPSRRLALSSTQNAGAALRTRHFALLHSTFALHARLYGEEEPATAAEMGRPATEVIGSGAGDFRTCVLRPHSIRRSR